MKIRILSVLIVLSLPSFLTAQVFLNLGFEHAQQGSSLPQKWYAGGDGYIVELDGEEHIEGDYSLGMFADKSSPKSFGVATGNFPVAIARGKQIRFSGYIKTSSLTK